MLAPGRGAGNVLLLKFWGVLESWHGNMKGSFGKEYVIVSGWLGVVDMQKYV